SRCQWLDFFLEHVGERGSCDIMRERQRGIRIRALRLIQPDDVRFIVIFARFYRLNQDIGLAYADERIESAFAGYNNRLVIKRISRLNDGAGIKAALMRQECIGAGMRALVSSNIRTAAALVQ